jgi:hypothetical protein
MSTTKTVNTLYAAALSTFITRLERHQGKQIDGENVLALRVESRSGYKFDYLTVVSTVPRPANPKKLKEVSRLAYIVERATGNIYAPLSPVSPNRNRWFGTVYNATKWDWRGQYGVNKRDETAVVMEDRQYGDFVYYKPAETDTASVVKATEQYARSGRVG